MTIITQIDQNRSGYLLSVLSRSSEKYTKLKNIYNYMTSWRSAIDVILKLWLFSSLPKPA